MAKQNPILRRKLSHEVQDRLLEFIKSGDVKPGDRMPSEHSIMEEYQVGRPAVREAMQSLQSMGLIEIRHGERATVKEPTAEGVFEQIDSITRHMLAGSKENFEYLKEARKLFESGLARIAAEKATPEDLKKLEQRLDKMKSLKGDWPKFMKADMSFHIGLAEISENPIFVAVSKAMLKWYAEIHDDLVGVPGLEELTIDEHQKILDCLINQDPDAASAMVSDHIMRVNDLYRKMRK